MSENICPTCKKVCPKDAVKCLNCGVALGDPLERVLDQIDKYDEGCEPRTLDDYDE